MNKKKIFGVLASASMLLNATPLSVFAEEMVETTPTGTVPGTDSTNVALDSTNFPDGNLLNAIKNQNRLATTAADVTTLEVPASVQSLEGLQYLTNLESFTMNGNNFIQSVDLSNNTALAGGLTVTDSQGNAPTTPVNPAFDTWNTYSNFTYTAPVTIKSNNVLTSITLPKTEDLTAVVITNNPSLDQIDLSPASLLEDAILSTNSLDALDLSQNGYLQTVNVANNEIYKLDATGCRYLENLNVNKNKIYELKTPTSSRNGFNGLAANHNKLTTFDASGLEDLTYLDLGDNMLKTVQLPKGPFDYLDLHHNHLASLNLKKVIFAQNANVNLSDQNLYANATDTAVNLKEYDANFDPDDATLADGTTMGSNGIFNIVGPSGVGSKTEFTEQYTKILVTVGPDGKITGVNVYVHGSLVDPTAYTLSSPLIGENWSDVQNTPVTVAAKQNSSYTGSAKVTPEKAITNANELKVAVQAKLAATTSTKKVTVYIDPSVSLINGDTLINPTYTVDKVFGTMNVGNKVYNLKFTKETSDPSGYTWYVEPGADATEDPATPAGYEAETAEMLEDAAPDWPVQPTNVKIHGTFTVTAANLAGPATCTFAMAEDDAALTTTLAPINGTPESITPPTENPEPVEGTTVDLSKVTNVKLTYDSTTGKFTTLSYLPEGAAANAEPTVVNAVDGAFEGLTLTPASLKGEDGTVAVPEDGVTVTGSGKATEEGTTYTGTCTVAQGDVTTDAGEEEESKAVNLEDYKAEWDATNKAINLYNSAEEDEDPGQNQVAMLEGEEVEGDEEEGDGTTEPVYTISTTQIATTEDEVTAATKAVYIKATPTQGKATEGLVEDLTAMDFVANTYEVVGLGKPDTDGKYPDGSYYGNTALEEESTGEEESTITVKDITSKTYTGTAQLPSITITVDGTDTPLTLNTNATSTGVYSTTEGYTVTFKTGTPAAPAEPKNAGEYTVEVTKAEDKGSGSYTIDKAALTTVTFDGDTTVTLGVSDTGDNKYTLTFDFEAVTATFTGNVDVISDFTLGDYLPTQLTVGSQDFTYDKTAKKYSATITPTPASLGLPSAGVVLTVPATTNFAAGTVTLTNDSSMNFSSVADGEEVTLDSYAVAAAPVTKSGDGETAVLETSTTSIGVTGKNSFYTYDTNNSDAPNMKVYIVKEDLMNRLYNPNSGEHFYTKDTHEKDVLVSLGWQYEGYGWVAPIESDEPVYRLYNPNAGDHHYTADVNEKDTLVRIGWNYEGIGWYSAQKGWEKNQLVEIAPYSYDSVDGLEVFREYNPNAQAAGAHNYTISENENDVLVSLGWLDEGIAWYGLK